jgi:hypothetical protein
VSGAVEGSGSISGPVDTASARESPSISGLAVAMRAHGIDVIGHGIRR